ncbi:alpha/beta hydrolase family protein [Paenibacillus mendelii]|uniref:Alpha/beta hydrolase family protein n=1 Tax=Paenibacillus mendelii TaxID=206163 RepID=A0ABV6JHW3_9BACL|nr:hypothetical protein [Paenibacillus mendelii]MCQ6563392.1 hypothetical protein [Paenibacillus mendelii]
MKANVEANQKKKYPVRKLMTSIFLSTAIAGGSILSAPTTLAESALADQTQKNAALVRFNLPEPTGPYKVGTTELHLVDRGRPDPWVQGKTRELMVSVWYPARHKSNQLALYMQPEAAAHYDRKVVSTFGLKEGQIDWPGIKTHGWVGTPVASRNGSYPVVLYSPGLGVPRTFGTILVEELASRGYVVVTIDHTYETSEVEFPGGRVEIQAEALTVPGADRVELLKKMMAVRELDVRFVLDQLAVLSTGGNPDTEQRELPCGLGDAIDLSRIGMFGHSAGGATAVQTMYSDRRIDAGINMDGTLGYLPDYLLPVVQHGLNRPFMLLGMGTNEDGQPDSHLTRADWKYFWEHSTGWKLDLNVPQGMHFTFTDYPAILPQLQEKLGLSDAFLERAIGTVDPTQIIATARAYFEAFFDLHLRHRSGSLLDAPSPIYPDIDFVE